MKMKTKDNRTHLTREQTVDYLKFFVLLNCGLFLTAMGIAFFKTPNHFAFGGTSGVSIILSTLFPKWNVGIFSGRDAQGAGRQRNHQGEYL